MSLERSNEPLLGIQNAAGTVRIVTTDDLAVPVLFLAWVTPPGRGSSPGLMGVYATKADAMAAFDDHERAGRRLWEPVPGFEHDAWMVEFTPGLDQFFLVVERVVLGQRRAK